MLVSLDISNVLLIDSLSLNLGPGLIAFTGETGAGKSILLDAITFALGGRSSPDLVQKNRGAKIASVTAAFEVEDETTINRILVDGGLEKIEKSEVFIIKRTLDMNGRSRAFINEVPVSMRMLKQVGECLIEIQGQFAAQGLLNFSTHRETLDHFANAHQLKIKVENSYNLWRKTRLELEELEERQAKSLTEGEFLRFSIEELSKLDPKPGEEKILADNRALLMSSENIINGLAGALSAISGETSINQQLNNAIRSLDRLASITGNRFNHILEALNGASDQLAEAEVSLNGALAELDSGTHALEQCEERLFDLRAAARKHRTTVDELPDLLERMETDLDLIVDNFAKAKSLRSELEVKRTNFLKIAAELTSARKTAARKLDQAVQKELAPLRMEKAKLHTIVETIEEENWGPTGINAVRFDLQTNPSSTPAPIGKIASGGELSRILLAIKVALLGSDPMPTLIFDEVDSGIGGATAAAVGKRLSTLAQNTQILVVTHSAQVAAHATSHVQVTKKIKKTHTETTASTLSDQDRKEEIARMLAGAKITDEARAAAESLLRGESR
ncbi:MAG: DNA repair protein RecN [Rhodospirillaceae bacterium]